MTNKIYEFQPKITLGEAGIQMMILQSLQHSTEMIYIIHLTLRIHSDIINEDNDKYVQEWMEDPIHQIHKCRGIG